MWAQGFLPQTVSFAVTLAQFVGGLTKFFGLKAFGRNAKSDEFMDEREGLKMVRRSWKSFLASIALVGGLAVSNTAFAGGEGCTPSCGEDGGCISCKQCEQIFADAGQSLTDQLASMSCCGNGCCDAGSCCAPTSVCDDACSDACGDPLSDSCGEGCGEGCDGLFGDCGSGIDIGGWTQFGYQSDPDGAFTGNGPFNNTNFGGGFNNANEHDKLLLNQQGMYVGKTADGSKGMDWGFRAEAIYGVDGNEAQSFGNNPGEFDFVNGFDHGIYEWGLPQLYAELAVGDHTVKVGHFYTLMGYEVIPSYGNFFLSRQLTFYNSEPFTHTGALVASKLSDNLTVHNGWVAGMDTGFDRLNQGSAYHGGFIYNVSDKVTFTYMLLAGEMGWRGNGAINSAYMTTSWTDKIQTVTQFDVLNSNLGSNFETTGVADNSTGLINYLFYTISDQLKAGSRLEWYKADGTSYHTWTTGVNITPMDHLVIRPEVRKMWSPGATNSAAAPGHDDLFNETVIGVDAIITY